VAQRQDELFKRFHLKFEILTHDKLEVASTEKWFLAQLSFPERSKLP